MEEEEGDWDEGPTIEEIISLVVKRKSKFGMAGRTLPSRPSSAVKNPVRESSSSPENDQVPKAKTMELKSCFQKSQRADVKTSSSVLDVVHDASALRNHHRLSPPENREKEVSNCSNEQLFPSSSSNHKMNRSVSTPEVRSKLLPKPPIKLEVVNSRSTDILQMNLSKRHPDQVMNNHLAGDKENKQPNAVLLEKIEENKYNLNLASKFPCQRDTILSANINCRDTPGKVGETRVESKLCVQSTVVPSSRSEYSNRTIKNDGKLQEQNSDNGVIKSRKISSKSKHFISDTRPAKIPNTSQTPYKTLQAQSLKTSLSLNSQQIGHIVTVSEAHHPSGTSSLSTTPTEGSHSNKSTVTGNRLTAPGIPQVNVEASQSKQITAPGIPRVNVEASQSKQISAVSSKETSPNSLQEKGGASSPQITTDNGYISGSVSSNEQASSNARGSSQIIDTSPEPQFKPRPPTPPINHKLKKMDHIDVNGHEYLKLGLLGRGGSSKVYEVLDLESCKVKAIKVVELEGLDKDTLKSYRNEIDILERLQWSDRVIKLYEFEHTENYLKLVMEKGNKDLASLVSSTRGSRAAPISPFTVKHYWHGMLLAVQAIHSEGIIHSDLKPANFILVNETVKLIDFGIASSIQQDMTSVIKDSQAGTFNYMSPESLMDVQTGPIINNLHGDRLTIKIGVKSDVWSLGCILYNLVYGRTPFYHLTNPLQKLAAISDPNTKIAFKEIEDKQLMEVMKLCLQFEPRKRPSIHQLLQHSYLTDKSQHSNSSPEKRVNLKSAIDQLAQLTPNSLNKITSMIKKMKPESSS